MKIVCLVSGGVDSTTLLFRLKKNHHDIIPLFINYGQKAYSQELKSIKNVCDNLKIHLEILDLQELGKIPSGLTSDFIDASKSPMFPGRNMIFLSIAASFAFSKSIDIIALGLLKDSSFPDQSEEFIKNMETVIFHAYGYPMKIWTPFINLNKIEVVRIAKKYDFPLNFTYSCYEGSEIPCRNCLSCKDRISVFNLEQINDI